VSDESLQDTYAPETACFGCGPANAKGLRIKSRVEGGEVVLDWTPEPHHEAFPGFVNGGIIGVLFDCHCNWAAAHHLMVRDGAATPPFTVTADYAVKLRRPTPSAGSLRLRARVVESEGDRAVVEATLEAEGVERASCRGTFVAVRPGHPAYRRWHGGAA
jgi:acyl-coenzyme A thioesterase PaaI-like protein